MTAHEDVSAPSKYNTPPGLEPCAVGVCGNTVYAWSADHLCRECRSDCGYRGTLYPFYDKDDRVVLLDGGATADADDVERNIPPGSFGTVVLVEPCADEDSAEQGPFRYHVRPDAVPTSVVVYDSSDLWEMDNAMATLGDDVTKPYQCIVKALLVSMGHLHEADRTWAESGDGVGVCGLHWYADTDDSLTLLIGDGPDSWDGRGVTREALASDGWASDLRGMAEAAWALGCQSIIFDTGGPELPQMLPLYEPQG